jgi:tripartite-type tricarboxylate transporter receptor subunit TctC
MCRSFAAGSIFLSLFALLLAVPLSAASQAWPTKPIRIIMPIIQGGSAELLLRLVAPTINESLGQPIVIENRPGGNGIAATEFVARSTPDGYTVAWSTSSQMISVPLLNKNATYDPFKDFSAIGPELEPVTLLIAGTTSAAKSLRQMIDYAKNNPGKLNYGGTGIGSAFHLRGEAIKMAAGVNILYVPYKGTTQAMQDAVAGRLDLTFGTPASTRGLRDAGKLVAIAVSNPSRFPPLPDVPSIREVVPGYENIPSLFALWGPAGLSPSIVRRTNGELLKAMEMPKVHAWLEDNGLVIEGRAPGELVALHKAGFETCRKIINAIGIKPE